MKQKVIYVATAVFTVFTGLCARAMVHWLPEWINLWLGDALYAFMMYYIIAVLFTSKPAALKAIVALALCYAIEFSQLYHANWINDMRATLPGRLILGQGFLLSDLAAYLAGVTAAFCVDILWFKPVKTAA